VDGPRGAGGGQRVHGGDRAPLDGAPRGIPGRLRVRTALSSRTGIRWVGGYAASAVNEFRRGEAEADRFSAQALLAMRDDLVALIDGPPR
jgi:hypothetical protein